MKNFSLPYGRTHLCFSLEDKEVAGVLLSGLHDLRAEMPGDELVKKALADPIGSLPLHKLAEGKKKVVIISSDHTRPVPSRVIMPHILEEIRRGNPDADVTILIATGLHRSTTVEELRGKFGDEIVDHEKIVIHDCDDEKNLVRIGTLPSGGDLIINRLAAEADLLVGEGFIEPHFFAGFSGGRKSVLPGVAGRATVMYNHNSGFIASEYARTGVIEGNPIHRDMLYAAKMARLAFIVNVVIDANHDAVYAVAGDLEEAHRVGREFLASHCRVAPVPADIAITTNGGYPLDQNLYQSVKGMTAAEATVKKGGVIIMCAEASDGHGGKSFYETFKNADDIGKLMESFLARPADKTIVDQWEAQIFARILLHARVILISSCPDDLVRDMHMIPAHGMDEALSLARKLSPENPTFTVIPDGVSVIVK